MKNDNVANGKTVAENPPTDATSTEDQYSTIYDHTNPKRDDTPYENLELESQETNDEPHYEVMM